jgi:predicted house-cleaning noncanonical NTP pyrophosphatase (MazG superfamily)
MTTRYDKLVRDRIPEIIEQEGETTVTHIADDAEYERRLREKLDEEVAEFEESSEIEELADVLEVVYAICASREIDQEALEQRRQGKADARGTFSNRIVLEHVE